MKPSIFLYGGGGHAKVVIDSLERQGAYELLWVVDDDPALSGKTLLGYPIIGGRSELLLRSAELPGLGGIVAIGVNSARRCVAEWLQSRKIPRLVVIHPSAQISRGVWIGDGTVVMAQAAINADAEIGEEVIVNTAASIDHDCVIGSGTHIAPGVRICGGVRIGGDCLIGAAAVITPGIRVGEGSVIGAGATVVRDVPDHVTVVGTPARLLNRD
jgi:sugar O-acyltransferase (sialic acid O-acetyltransferase NeuD family)